MFRNVVAVPSHPGNAPWNLSVVVGECAGALRQKHHLNVQGELTFGITDDGRLVSTMARILGILASDRLDGTLRLRGSLVVRADGSAVVIDHRLLGTLQRTASRLERLGLRVVHTPWVDIDPGSGRVLLPDAAGLLGFDIEEFGRRFPSSALIDGLEAMEAPVAVLAYPSVYETESEASTIAALAPIVSMPDHTMRTADVSGLVELGRRVQTVGIDPGDTGSLHRVACGDPANGSQGSGV